MDKGNLSNSSSNIQVTENILVEINADELDILNKFSDHFFYGMAFDHSLVFDKLVDSYILGIEKNKAIKIIVS